MRAWGLVVAALPLAVSCHEYRPDPKLGPPAAPASAASGGARAPLPEWVPAPAANVPDPLAPTASDPDGGALIHGQRVTRSGAAASQVTTPQLVAGIRIPKHAGGGFLFWSGNALFFARTFVADLEPVAALDAAVDRVSFGSGYALLHSMTGARHTLSWPGRKRIALPVAGLIDAGTLADGRAVILVEPDLVLTLGAGQKTWRDMTATARPVSNLLATDAALWLKRTNGEVARVEADGSFTAHATLPDELTHPTQNLRDPRWPTSVSELPLARAVRRGVPVDEHTAVVEIAGAFARIDLGSGALLDMTPAVLASAQECELLPVEEDVLALCRTTQGTALVVSGVKGQSPKVERSFGRSGSFFAGSLGTLLFGGPCEERTVTTPVVCVRQRDRSWRELGEPAKAAAAAGDGGAAQAAPNITRWVPTRDGGALGLVPGAGGGLYNAATAELTRFTNDQHLRHGGLFGTPGGLLVDDLALGEDGRIVGYVGDSALALHSDGRVDRSPQVFRFLRNSGALALAHDAENRLWQSNDFGLQWVEVARPPGMDARAPVRPERCSRVGCELPGWYRLGYRKSQPRPAKLAIVPRPALTPRAKAPRLVCERTSPPQTRWVTRARSADGTLTEEFDFGARKIAAREGVLATIAVGFDAISDELSFGATLFERAMEDSNAAGFGGLLAKNRTLRFVDPLGDAKIAEARFSWQDVFTRAVQSGSEAPTAVGEERRGAIPVLLERSPGSAGLLINDTSGVLFWARPGQALRILSLGRENVGFSALGAVVRGKDELLVLAEDDICSARVVSVTAAGARTLLELPARASRRSCPVNRDALALADDGSIAVLRMPSTEFPSADDPALSLRPGQKPVALAPWSTLSACGADSTGIRALVAVQSSWVKLEAPGIGRDDDSFTYAVVRWSESRVCAESVAVPATSVELGGQEIDTLVLARFGATPRADRRGFAQGAEHTEALSCKLSSP